MSVDDNWGRLWHSSWPEYDRRRGNGNDAEQEKRSKSHGSCLHENRQVNFVAIARDEPNAMHLVAIFVEYVLPAVELLIDGVCAVRQICVCDDGIQHNQLAFFRVGKTSKSIWAVQFATIGRVIALWLHMMTDQ